MKNIDPLVSDEWESHSSHSRKNTKQWCKGKIGVHHVPETILDKNYGFMDSLGKARCFIETESDGTVRKFCTHQVICKNCGKSLEYRPKICPVIGRLA